MGGHVSEYSEHPSLDRSEMHSRPGRHDARVRLLDTLCLTKEDLSPLLFPDQVQGEVAEEPQKAM